MNDIADFLTDWGRRWSDAIAAAVRDLPADVVTGRIYGAAITVADGNTVPGLYVHTESHLAEIADPDTDPDNARHYRWWPDESGLDFTTDALSALSVELGDWAIAHPRSTSGRGDGENHWIWSREWIAQSDRALILAIGAEPVRQAFAAFGADPVLSVTETDGGASRALAAFEALNSHRDDDLARDARAFWQDNVDSLRRGIDHVTARDRTSRSHWSRCMRSARAEDYLQRFTTRVETFDTESTRQWSAAIRDIEHHSL